MNPSVHALFATNHFELVWLSTANDYEFSESARRERYALASLFILAQKASHGLSRTTGFQKNLKIVCVQLVRSDVHRIQEQRDYYYCDKDQQN